MIVSRWQALPPSLGHQNVNMSGFSHSLNLKKPIFKWKKTTTKHNSNNKNKQKIPNQTNKYKKTTATKQKQYLQPTNTQANKHDKFGITFSEKKTELYKMCFFNSYIFLYLALLKLNLNKTNFR